MNFAKSLPVNFLWNSITAQFTYMKRKGSLQKLNQQLMFPEFFFYQLECPFPTHSNSRCNEMDEHTEWKHKLSYKKIWLE